MVQGLLPVLGDQGVTTTGIMIPTKERNPPTTTGDVGSVTGGQKDQESTNAIYVTEDLLHLAIDKDMCSVCTLGSDIAALGAGSPTQGDP